MNTWFADTYFFLALLDEGDEAHPKARAIASRLETDLVTTAWVLTEVADGLADSKQRSRVVALFETLHSHERVIILPADQPTFDRGFSLYAERPDKDWSLTDCISFVVMEEYHIAEALTGDHHFEQAGFTALLK